MAHLAEVRENMATVIRGKDDVLELVLTCLLARGHVLLEDVPGLGKTVLARALARSLDGDYRRLQCTPDLLPSDVTGVSVFHPKDQTFEFRPGPVFTQVLLADEINRATPRTQSALLEAMAEHQVTVDGETRSLPDPFFLIATQNPLELGGTFPLPEAQLDRFLMQLRMGYPTADVEVEIMAAQAESHPIDELRPCLAMQELVTAQAQCRAVFIHECILRYIQEISHATREAENVSCGASPRGSVALMAAAKALAYLRGDAYVTPDHVKTLAAPVLGHRLLLDPRARVKGQTGHDVVRTVLDEVAVPVDFQQS